MSTPRTFVKCFLKTQLITGSTSLGLSLRIFDDMIAPHSSQSDQVQILSIAIWAHLRYFASPSRALDFYTIGKTEDLHSRSQKACPSSSMHMNVMYQQLRVSYNLSEVRLAEKDFIKQCDWKLQMIASLIICLFTYLDHYLILRDILSTPLTMFASRLHSFVSENSLITCTDFAIYQTER